MPKSMAATVSNCSARLRLCTSAQYPIRGRSCCAFAASGYGAAWARRLRNAINDLAEREQRDYTVDEDQCHKELKTEIAGLCRIRVRVEHVFGSQQTATGGRIVRTARIVRARAKIGLQNLTYNIRHLVTLDRLAAA